MDIPQGPRPPFQPPFGYDVTRPYHRQAPRSRRVIDPEAAAIVREIFRLATEGFDPETIAGLLGGDDDDHDGAMKP